MGYDKLEQDNTNLEQYWNAAIGLQKVDDLEPSDYLYELKEQNINNKISNEDIEVKLYEKYDKDSNFLVVDRQKECDIVINRMVEILSSRGSFRLIPSNFAMMHGILFKDLFDQLDEKYVGKFRDYNISKKEPILNGKSVIYSDFREIKNTLEYDMETERCIDYKKLTQVEVIKHISNFTSRIWQVHPFIEGNTRTTAIFIEKYLNQLGFNVNNDMFFKHSEYFRNALVRANYYDDKIVPDDTYLNKFFANLLFGENNELNDEDFFL